MRDYTGEIIGNLKVLSLNEEESQRLTLNSKSHTKVYAWNCVCTVCGDKSVKRDSALRSVLQYGSSGCKVCNGMTDLTGEIFGNIRVLGLNNEATESSIERYHKKVRIWNCECIICGQQTTKRRCELNKIRKKNSTGCKECNTLHLVGQRFGKLVVIKEIEPRIHTVSTTGEVQKIRMFLCQCDCGKKAEVPGISLKSGHTKSCGCYAAECTSKRLLGTGQRRGRFLDSHYDRLFSSWNCMKRRCSDPNNNRYYTYGARGITVCSEWENDFNAFAEWSIEHDYAPDLSIDRINVNGNYEPSNCKWSTREEQMNNRTDSRILSFNGEEHTLAEWSRITGIQDATIRHRIDALNFTVEEALTLKTDGRYTRSPNKRVLKGCEVTP